MPYYISLQYSGIQKIVLRYDRLWSISGMSRVLSELNELIIPKIVVKNGGKVLICGGGKVTASFEDFDLTRSTRECLIQKISTTLPMLEFQCSEIIEGESFKQVRNPLNNALGILVDINNKKKTFRGYGFSFNPHFLICQECGEYPAIIKSSKDGICRFCLASKNESNQSLAMMFKNPPAPSEITFQKIYRKFTEVSRSTERLHIPLDFNNLFQNNNQGNNNRLGVWFSDLNNMNEKIRLWLNQEDDKLFETFDKVTSLNIDIIVNALTKTFSSKKIEDDNVKETKYLPFRLIVAGGDDLCIVMDAHYIVDFSLNMSESLKSQINNIHEDHPLHINWLKGVSNANDAELNTLANYSFGGSFIVTSVHTPFRRIHRLGEKLLKQTKIKTNRRDNGINWEILDTNNSIENNTGLYFEKPLLIDKEDENNNQKHEFSSFAEYVSKARFYSNYISNSHMYQLAAGLNKYNDSPGKFEQWLKRNASPTSERAYSFILVDDFFKNNGTIVLAKIATMLEVMSLLEGGNNVK